MESSQMRALTISQQLARLRLHRFSSAGSAMRSLEGQVAMATKSSLGEPTDIGAIGAATLAWEMAMLAQSCAYLAEEAQIWAQKSVDRTLTSRESTYRQLLDSVGTMRRLLDTMHRMLHANNVKEDANGISVLSDLLVEEIRFMLARGSAITTAECMTSIESRGTNSTADVGDTR
jgi:ABC-type cobalamin transport system ATPase subunit